MALSDHYNTVPLYSYSSKSYKTYTPTEVIEQTKTTYSNPQVTDYGPFADKLSGTLEMLENEWEREVDASKRGRGVIYGLAGKKANLHERKTSNPKDKTLPGLQDWLGTASEFEKEAVHKFISKVSDTFDTTTKPEMTVPNVRIHSAGSIHQQNSRTSPKVRFRMTLKSAPPLLRRASTEREVWSPAPKNDVVEDNVSVISSVEEINEEIVDKDVSTQIPQVSRSQSISPANGMKVDKRPSSRTTTHRRSISTPASLKHSCLNCEACKKKLMQRMLKDMSITHPRTYTSPQTPTRQTPIMMDDYVHHGTSFQNVGRFPRGNFVIHPDFVSEAASHAEVMRRNKKHHKYFGTTATVY